MRDILESLGTPIPMEQNYRRVDNHTTTLHLSLPNSATSSIETQVEKYEAVSNLVSSSNDRPPEIAEAFSSLINFCKQIDLSEQNESVSRKIFKELIVFFTTNYDSKLPSPRTSARVWLSHFA